MFRKILIPLLLLVLIYILYVQRQSPVDVTIVKSKIDNQDYIVQNKKDKQVAADTLAIVKQNMIKLVDFCKTHHKEDARTQRLALKFNPNVVIEGTEDPKYTTYTLNKGEKMVFCLRTRDNQDTVHDINLLTFVAIHELGHVCTISEGHTPEFDKNFQFLIQQAVKSGIYKPVDYRKSPQPYCGIQVTDTPLGQEYFT